MKNNCCIFWISLTLLSCTQNKSSTLKAILQEQLVNSHTTKDWYVPVRKAVEGISAEQANWRDSSDNHSIGQLVEHLAFWNERVLQAFKGNTVPDFEGDNEKTFTKFSKENWKHTTDKLDSIQIAWETVVGSASESKLQQWGSSIANMAAHNAYHTGQIIYIRKRNGWWKSIQ